MKLFKLVKEFLSNEDGFFPIITLAALAIGTATSVYGQVKGNAAAKNAERARRGAEETAAARERLRIVREARIRRAEVLQAAENTGTSGSTGALGAEASIGTQLQSNLGFINAQRTFASDESRARLQANKAQLISGLGESAGNFGLAFNDYIGYKKRKAAEQAKFDATVPVN